jgi:transglutaminase-like putative cysteine protease
MPAHFDFKECRPRWSGKAVMTETQTNLLAPARFIDSGAPAITSFAREQAADGGSELDRVLRLYHAVRDAIAYDPYVDLSDPANFRASGVLAAGRGFCVGKAALLAACCRAIGIPARVGYADVRNHLTSPRMYEYIKSDVFVWHSYADIHIGGRWVKATPAFDLALCRRVGVGPLEFDGQSDSLFQPFDPTGRRHMEYLLDRGTFADVPFEAIQADFRAAYPSLMNAGGLGGDFRAEAVAAEDEPQDSKTKT